MFLSSCRWRTVLLPRSPAALSRKVVILVSFHAGQTVWTSKLFSIMWRGSLGGRSSALLSPSRGRPPWLHVFVKQEGCGPSGAPRLPLSPERCDHTHQLPQPCVWTCEGFPSSRSHAAPGARRPPLQPRIHLCTHSYFRFVARLFLEKRERRGPKEIRARDTSQKPKGRKGGQ